MAKRDFLQITDFSFASGNALKLGHKSAAHHVAKRIGADVPEQSAG